MAEGDETGQGKKGGLLKDATLKVILATALGTILILGAAAAFMPGLNSLKIQLFQATVEIDNREDAFEVLEGLKKNADSRLLLEAWLDKEGYVALDSAPAEDLPEAERERIAVQKAAKFKTLVPSSELGLQQSREEMQAALKEFEQRTGKATLAGQLRSLAQDGAPPFNMIGVSAKASVPWAGRDAPPQSTINVRQDAEWAKYLQEGDIVELANPNSPRAAPILAKVRKRSITSETDVHVRRSQWCHLQLKPYADERGTSEIIIIPKRAADLAESGASDNANSMVSAGFLENDLEPC